MNVEEWQLDDRLVESSSRREMSDFGWARGLLA